MPYQMVQKLIFTVILLVIIIGVVGYQILQMQTQSYAEEVAYATTLFKQAGDFVRMHAAHGGEAKFGSQLKFGAIKLTREGMCLVRFDVGGGDNNIITLYQGTYSQLRYETPRRLYGETWIFDRGDGAHAYVTDLNHIDMTYHNSMAAYTYVTFRTAVYVALTKTAGVLTVNIYIFYLVSKGTGGTGAFTLTTHTEPVGEHLRFMSPSGSTGIALYIQSGTDPNGHALEEQAPLPSVSPGDLVDITVNQVKVDITWQI
jgi:hypothetical protein